MTLVSCVMAQITCGSLYLNMASFFPVYADGKFNAGSGELETESGNDSDQVITVTQISFCIVAFELACLIASPIHAKTISLMGRKNAILIGFAI